MGGNNSDFLSAEQLRDLGFARLGEAVLIHSTAVLVNCAAMSIGSHVRIDPFTVLSAGDGGISIGRNVHIAAHCAFVGSAAIELGDFCGISHGSRILSASDDFGGDALTGPTVPSRYRSVTEAPISIGRHVIVGSGTVILPGASIGEGAAVGALSLVNKRLEGWMIHAGQPARAIRPRSRKLLELEQSYLSETTSP